MSQNQNQEHINDVLLKVKLLEKDVQVVNNIAQKLSESIEKIQEMNMNLIKMISLHDQKHMQHDREESDLKEDIKDLHSRITTVNREVQERIDQVERHITSRIDALRTDLITHKKEDLPDDTTNDKMSDKIADIEKWRWILVGAIAVIAWIIGESDLIGRLFK